MEPQCRQPLSLNCEYLMCLFCELCCINTCIPWSMMRYSDKYQQSQNKLDIWDTVTSRDPLHSVKAHTRAVRLLIPVYV